MSASKDWSRRHFLQSAAATAAGLANRNAALGLLAGAQAAATQAATEDYRALVCIFLAGGNDGFNVLIPSDTTRYQTYKTARGNLAFSTDQLLALNASTSKTYAVSTSAPGFQALYNKGQLAFLANVGTLLEPTSKKAYLAGTNLPPQLYSHSDQSDQGMANELDALQKLGWGGRIADLLSPLNGTSTLPLGVSIGGNNLFQIGSTAVPYYMGTSGVSNFYVTSNGNTDPRTRAFNKMLAASVANGGLLEQEFGQSVQKTLGLSQTLIAALAKSSVGSGIWPGSYLAQQLQMVARMISVRNTFGVKRQVFYVVQGGYDTHDDQPNRHNALINDLSAAVAAFHSTMDEFGIGNGVTSFTLSDFGRTLTSNGDGSDHAWGNVQMVAGGSVLGGNVYGTFPNQTIDGPDDASYGRLIPTTSIDQYGATLARWFGANDTDLATIFPHLSRFNSADVGFMSLA
ncbi:DUF1501 domain-containing protein [Methylovulum psychrotolerans]|uniref:Tat pathway signal protein n=1 Tax=Methylovulum psychrotolerans TaxID=1704499 RepID=A0A1Z4BZX0_9GAMM|nr:DUF1501 domain-containing protein [Methylovulum psychrotolerans]ASF46801.1 hypothetical protein CEK71_12340 [Methylovulum psychrotolerans]POZ51968.1 hypothetical protein AADEFJLK_02189 [Methylovulum psychrotolerans]